MLSLLIAWFLLAAVSLVAGAALVRVAGYPPQISSREDRFIAATWLGLLAVGSAALALAVFLPLRPWLLLFPLVLLAAPSVRRAVTEAAPTRRIACVMLIIPVGILPIESNQSLLYDSALYHTQLTSWMATHGLPPGIGLLHYRMGFSSSWLALTALFDHGFLASRMENVIGGFAVLLLITQLVFALERAGRGDGTAGDRYNAGAIPTLLVLGVLMTFVASPSPNFGAAAALVVAGWLLVSGTSALAMMIGAGAVAIKLTIVPAFAATLSRAAISRKYAPIFAIAAALAIPLPLANFQTTGCPAFPGTVLCADILASVPPSVARAAAMDTINYGRNGGQDYAAPYWDASWIHGWLTRGLNPYLLALAFACFLVVVLARTWNRAATLAAFHAAYCAAGSPDVRFALPSVAIFAGCATMALLPRIRVPALLRQSALVWTLFGTTLLLAAAAYGGTSLARYLGDQRPILTIWASRWLAPAAGFRYGISTKKSSVNGIEYSMPPKDDRCGSIAIPCTPYPLTPDIRFCDARQGFAGGLCRR